MFTLDETDPFISKNWYAQMERYPFLQDPYRQSGAYPALSLTTDLQARMRSVKSGIAAVMGVCSCKMGDGVRIALPPDGTPAPFSVSMGVQAIVDLQTGHLHISREPLDLAKAHQRDWQQFLQFPINV